jgi:hypothetical protein
MRHSNKLVKSDKSISPIRNQKHFASIRSIFVDRSVTLLTHMLPSLVNFFNFPKDKQMYLFSLCTMGRHFEGIGHQMLIIISLSTDKLGTLCIYDPLDEKQLNSHLNLESVRDAMIYCKVGGTDKWSISTNPYFPGPRQKENYCRTTCSCLALDYAGHKDVRFRFGKMFRFKIMRYIRSFLVKLCMVLNKMKGRMIRILRIAFFLTRR